MTKLTKAKKYPEGNPSKELTGEAAGGGRGLWNVDGVDSSCRSKWQVAVGDQVWE